MNPYSRFGLVSNTVSAAALLSLLVLIGPSLISTLDLKNFSGTPADWLSVGGIVAVMVVVWIAMTEAIFPSLFRLNTIRRMVLGKYYFEGTWLQSEKGDTHQRLSVIDIQPDGKGFIFSGYSLNADLEIESNTLIEFSKLEWPFMTHKYRNSLSDGADGRREGVGEIQFEMNRAASRRYNGFVQYVRYAKRARIEGAKLTSNSEVRNLRTLKGRQKVFQKYWDLFFNAGLQFADSRAPHAPLEVNEVSPATKPRIRTRQEQTSERVRSEAESAPAGEKSTGLTSDRRTETAARRSAPAEGVVPRRRSSDWDRGPLFYEDTHKGAPLENLDKNTKK